LFAKKQETKKQKAINIKKASSKLDPKIASSAGAIVPLLGNETSPEMLVEMAAAIQSKKVIQALNITEVPSQTDLDAFLEDSPTENSLKRRLSRLSESQKISVDFEAVVTHELSDTINQLSSQSSCDWLVMGWDGRPTTGIFITNPIGWLLANINSNLALYRDNGVRYVGKVLLALRPGRKDKNFISIAKNVCDYFGGSLTLLHVVPENSSTTETVKHRSEEKLKQAGVDAEVLILKSSDPVETISETSAGYDLLILGTPEKDNWIKVLFGGGKDKFTERAACSVLRITLKD
jgi:nucleotide-binding universal stress UspA family protein